MFCFENWIIVFMSSLVWKGLTFYRALFRYFRRNLSWYNYFALLMAQRFGWKWWLIAFLWFTRDNICPPHFAAFCIKYLFQYMHYAVEREVRDTINMKCWQLQHIPVKDIVWKCFFAEKQRQENKIRYWTWSSFTSTTLLNSAFIQKRTKQ